MQPVRTVSLLLLLLAILTRCTPSTLPSPSQDVVTPNQLHSTSWRLPPSPLRWRIPSSPLQVYTTVAVPAYSYPDISSQFIDVIPPHISLQVVRLTEGWYQVTWRDRDDRLRWIEASRVTPPPPKETHPSSHVALPAVAEPPPTS